MNGMSAMERVFPVPVIEVNTASEYTNLKIKCLSCSNILVAIKLSHDLTFSFLQMKARNYENVEKVSRKLKILNRTSTVYSVSVEDVETFF